MRRITLKEFEPSEPLALSDQEVEALLRLAPQVRIAPSCAVSGQYELTPDAHVGVVRFGETVVEIRPK